MCKGTSKSSIHQEKMLFSLPEMVSDRKICNSYRANYFRLFLYGAAFVLAHRMKHTVFKGTEVERFNMDSIIKRIMLSAVHIVEKKTYIKISFSPHHRHREELETALTRMAA